MWNLKRDVSGYEVRKINKIVRLLGTSATQEHQSSCSRDHLFSIAPMMEYTDKFQRFLMRMISRKSVLYTEMITANALTRTDNPTRFLGANLPVEDLVVLQLGGADIERMRAAASMSYEYGYKEININVGCPSPKVAGSGCFGAALMQNPTLVSEISASIFELQKKPVTVKCRIGVDDNDSYENLGNFISKVSSEGYVKHFIIHARKAILDPKFSPHDNRNIPPLKYSYVHRLVGDFPSLSFSINGGLNNYTSIQEQLTYGVRGVMVGRAVINNPYYWRNVDSLLYKEADPGKLD